MRSGSLAIWLFVILQPSHATAQSLAGYWYGQGYQPLFRDTSQFIAHYRGDGAFEIHFRTYKNCVLTKDQREAGTWIMLNQRTVRITTISVNGVPAGPYVDDYRVEELTDRRYRYVWLSKKVEFSAIRVDARFSFPDCELVS